MKHDFTGSYLAQIVFFADMRSQYVDKLHAAIMRLARKRMEILFSHAIDRFKTKYHWEVYDGRAWHFRWGRDCQLYHWRDFEEFYGENSDYEWLHAQELLASDDAFVIPNFLLNEVANDL